MRARLSPWCLLAHLVLAGCAQPPVAAQLPHLEPFNTLRGVRLRMTADDLKRARPQARPHPYVGYSEKVGPHELQYHFPGSVSENQVVPDRSRLQGVSYVQTHPSDAAARAAWAPVLAGLWEDWGEPDQCLVMSGLRRVSVRWSRGATRLTTEMTGPDPPTGPADARPRATILVRLERTGPTQRLLGWIAGGRDEVVDAADVACPK